MEIIKKNLTKTSPAQRGQPSSDVFISYRRDDTAGYAGWLFTGLTNHFGKKRAIFRDVDKIEWGKDFIEVINNHMESCEILLAVIGKQWLTITDDEGVRRLDNPKDLVRVEVETALSRNITVIPILIEGASMPREKELPEGLAKLSRLNALTMNNATWDDDLARLIKTIEKNKKNHLWLKIMASLLLLCLLGFGVYRLVPHKKNVFLMDSYAQDVVYDPETKKQNLTNAYDINNVLSQLKQLQLTPRLVGKSGNQPESIKLEAPDLIIIHWSAFYGVSLSINGVETNKEDESFILFIRYMEKTKTKFLVYTRENQLETEAGQEQWFAHMEKEMPEFKDLRGRVFLFPLRGGRSLKTFRDDVIANDLIIKVKSILELE